MLLCASCPLLTVPTFSDSNSSCSSLSTSPATASGHAQPPFDTQHYGKTSSDSWSVDCWPLDQHSEEDFCLISSDILLEVVKGAFGLNAEMMLMYSQQVRQQYRKKKDAKILAEDLLYQLSLMEMRKHPYYSPQKFAVFHFLIVPSLKCN